jgi:hypothetical protein
VKWGPIVGADTPEGSLIRKRIERDDEDAERYWQERPDDDLGQGLLSIWSAFWRLHRSRPSGMGIEALPYPWLLVDAFVFGPHLGADGLVRWVHHLQAMDGLYRKIKSDEIESKRPRPPGGSGGGKPGTSMVSSAQLAEMTRKNAK